MKSLSKNITLKIENESYWRTLERCKLKYKITLGYSYIPYYNSLGIQLITNINVPLVSIFEK